MFGVVGGKEFPNPNLLAIFLANILNSDVHEDHLYMEKCCRIPLRALTGKSQQRKTLIATLSDARDQERVLMAARWKQDILFEGKKILSLTRSKPCTPGKEKGTQDSQKKICNGRCQCYAYYFPSSSGLSADKGLKSFPKSSWAKQMESPNTLSVW